MTDILPVKIQNACLNSTFVHLLEKVNVVIFYSNLSGLMCERGL